MAKKAQASLALEGELVEGGLAGMVEDDLMVALAKSLIAGEGADPIIDLSSARSEEDDFITELVPHERSVLEALEDMFASRPAEASALPAEIIQDVLPRQPITRLVFTDAPVVLGHGRKGKKVDAGVGLLFPELMGV